jgi:hypothetical protein
MADHLGWSADRTAREIDEFLSVAQRARPNLTLGRSSERTAA